MRIIRLDDVKKTTGLARSTIYKYMDAKLFPKAVPLGGKAVGWVESEVQEWVMSRIEERDEGQEPLSSAKAG